MTSDDRDYAQARVREALRIKKGDRAAACRLVAGWAHSDSRLMGALAVPHLTALVAHAVEHVADVLHRESQDPPPRPRAPKTASRPLRHLRGDAFGKDLLMALTGEKPTLFGQESFAPPLARTPTSQRHIDTLRALAVEPPDPSSDRPEPDTSKTPPRGKRT